MKSMAEGHKKANEALCVRYFKDHVTSVNAIERCISSSSTVTKGFELAGPTTALKVLIR